MSELIAKPVIKNKFWVVEEAGQKVATIQAVNDGIVYVHKNKREKYPSVKILSKHYNIKFTKETRQKNIKKSNDVYGFPVTGKPFNEIFDVQRRLPIYTKTAKSKSHYCAGYYLILLNDNWISAYCPKNITINRYQYCGPFKTEQDMFSKLGELNAKS